MEGSSQAMSTEEDRMFPAATIPRNVSSKRHKTSARAAAMDGWVVDVPDQKMMAATTTTKKPADSADGKEVNALHGRTTTGLSTDILLHSSLAVASCKEEFDRAYDEETVAMMSSPLGEQDEPYGTDVEANDRVGNTMVESLKPSISDNSGNVNPTQIKAFISNHIRDDNDAHGKADEPHGDMSRESSKFDKANISVEPETEPCCNIGREASRLVGRSHLLETEPVSDSNENASNAAFSAGNRGGSSNTAGHDPAIAGDENEKVRAQQEEHTRIELTTADIGVCIEAIFVARQIKEAHASKDLFHGINIEQLHLILVGFKTYLTALSDLSTTEAKELQQNNDHENAFLIFRRGLSINHCNALFIRAKIQTISSGIHAHSESSSYKKLNQLAACLDMIFDVSKDSDQVVAVSVCRVQNSRKEVTTVLKFFKLQNDILPPSRSREQMLSSLPQHLQAVSRAFEQFAAESTRSLQSQLDFSRETLADTREDAMDLQRKALKMQDDLLAAQTEAEEAKSRQGTAETELERLRYEFRKKEETFERLTGRKELELANVKEQYGQELKEAKEKAARVKHKYDNIDQRKQKESDGSLVENEQKYERDVQQTQGSMRPKTHKEPSISGKREYSSINSPRSDKEGTRKRRKISNHQLRHPTDNMKSSKLPKSFDLQPPSRSRDASEQKLQAADRTKNQHYEALTRTAVQDVSGHNGQFGELGSKEIRNPLKSPTKNRSIDTSGSDFRERKGSRNIRERPCREVEEHLDCPSKPKPAKPFDVMNGSEHKEYWSDPKNLKDFFDKVMPSLDGARCALCEKPTDPRVDKRCDKCGVLSHAGCCDPARGERSTCLTCRLVEENANILRYWGEPRCQMCSHHSASGGPLVRTFAKPKSMNRWDASSIKFQRSLFGHVQFCHALCVMWNPQSELEGSGKCKDIILNCSSIVMANGKDYRCRLHRCSLCGLHTGAKVDCCIKGCIAPGGSRYCPKFHVTCARQAGLEVTVDVDLSVKCWQHLECEFVFRARLGDLKDIELNRFSGETLKAANPMTWSHAASLFHAAVNIMRTLGWAWRWAEWWVEYGDNWEPLIPPGQVEAEMTWEELKVVNSTPQSRCDDARKCRLAAFGAALRNRDYDNEEGEDQQSLERALTAVISTRSLVGPLEKDEVEFFVTWLALAYRSKSPLLGFGQDKAPVATDCFCIHQEDGSPKCELGGRPLPGKARPQNDKGVFEPIVKEVDDFLKVPLHASPRRKSKKKTAD
eukprot:CAMPEP_0183725136 /NCGR_PEP_ID=MMETSP0737-20130205/19634_1 /TAXON_ID=385413 /ORGANISM="Thalassiosira miniscula, Strain CCMP1093" /LENGTH=1246 /DNA_ID=CAMNT_0025955981 /DNA_START=67 /DNA_END=3807 /DNA_ORIENTATION=+